MAVLNPHSERRPWMARSIVAAVERIKADVAHWITPRVIHELCRALEHRWRERVLDPATTVHLFLLQILHGNTACSHVPRLGGINCSGEAYCQARGRLPLALFECLVLLIRDRLPRCSAEGLWRGHRTFLLDGSSTSMPDTPDLQQAFGQPGAQKPGCGFPVMHLLALFDAATGLLLSLVPAPLRTHDMSQIETVHPELQPGDVLVGDRGFCSFAHLALLAARNVFGVFRAHQRQIVDFRPRRRSARKGEKGRPTSRWLERLGRHDQLVEYIKPVQRPKWMTEDAYAALPESLIVRELRYTIRIPGRRTRHVTLATTLLDANRYPAEALAELYGQRWKIETNFRHLKQTLHMDVLHCQTLAGVQKELAMYALVYNLIRCVMLEAAEQQEVPVDRVSFVDAARWLSEACDGDAAVLKLRVNPSRVGRFEPRAVKRRPKEYNRMNQPREVLRKKLLEQQDAA
jgi:Transposase DDE domain